MNDIKSLSHSKYRCKYHIVFAPKYRRQIIYGKLKEEIGKVVKKTDTAIEDVYVMEDADTFTRMKEMVNLNFKWFMQTLLDRKDRMSMYSGLEVRVPFCDYRIAEYLYAVPWAFKDYKGQEKGLLRQSMDSILPHSVLYRKKSPFPKTHDPHYLELASKLLEQIILDKHAPIFQFVKREALENLINQDFPWPWYGQLMRRPQTIVYMLQINYWLQHYSVRIV